MTPITGLLACLKGAVRSGDGWTARCPAHDDRRNSLSVHHRHGRWLLKCHAGCGWQAIVDALGADAADLFDDEKRGAGSARPSNNRATAQPATVLSGTSGPPRSLEELASAQSGPTGLTLDGYATAKRLPTHFVKSCGLSEFTFDHKPAVRIPYFGAGGEELAVRFRIALDGDRFRWKSGTKPCLYGLHRLHDAHKARHVVLVEGESDCHTLWFHEIPALGIPGATNWREERDARYLDGIETIYVVVEPDRGGDAVRKWLSRSTILDECASELARVGGGRRASCRPAYLPRRYIPSAGQTGFGSGQGAILGRQVIRHRTDAEILPPRGVLLTHGHERPGAGLLQRAAKASPSRHLRGGGNGFGFCDVSDPVVAV